MMNEGKNERKNLLVANILIRASCKNRSQLDCLRRRCRDPPHLGGAVDMDAVVVVPGHAHRSVQR
jgi:hypothetical protein